MVGNVADDGFCDFVAICAAKWLQECFCESDRGTLGIVLRERRLGKPVLIRRRLGKPVLIRRRLGKPVLKRRRLGKPVLERGRLGVSVPGRESLGISVIIPQQGFDVAELGAGERS